MKKFRSIRFLVSSPDPTQEETESLVTFGQSLGFLGNSLVPRHLRLGYESIWGKVSIYNVENTICGCNTGKPQHNDSNFMPLKIISHQFSTASYEFLMKPKVSAECHLVGRVLVLCIPYSFQLSDYNCPLPTFWSYSPTVEFLSTLNSYVLITWSLHDVYQWIQ